MEYIMGIVAELDTPSQQVVLEVFIVELCEEAGKEFGLDWKSDNQHVSVSMSHGLGIFEGIAKYTSVPANEFTSLLFTLKMLVSEGKAGIRSRPRVATLNGEKASIDMSLDEYYSIVTDLGSYDGALRTELQVIKSGVRLEITPHIGDNNDITVNVITEVSDVASRQNQVTGQASGGSLPVIRRRKADTCVRVKEGDAIVIGGLIETQEQNNVEKVPILGDIPLVGGLFHSTKSHTMEKEVMIFITPRLMKEGKDVFSDRHKLIDAEEELDALREVAALPDKEGKDVFSDKHKLIDAEEELDALAALPDTDKF
jgi:type II secretory pathway component GspD/PulD (secretin)